MESAALVYTPGLSQGSLMIFQENRVRRKSKGQPLEQPMPFEQRYKVFLGFIADAMNLSCQVAGDEQQAYLVGYPLQLPAP